MTDADTQAGAAAPVATVIAGSGLVPEPGIVDASGLATVAGPLLVADLVDQGGQRVGVVAVVDDPADEPDAMLQSLAGAAAAEAAGTTVEPSDPVAGGDELAALFTAPVTVAAFGHGGQIRAVVVMAIDRRAGGLASTGTASTGTAPTGAASTGAAGTASPVGAIPGADGTSPLDKLINVSLAVSVELGRTRVTLAEVLDYDVGSVIELDRAAGAPVDIRVNDTLLALGEVVLIDDEYAVRITAILDPNKRA